MPRLRLQLGHASLNLHILVAVAGHRERPIGRRPGVAEAPKFLAGQFCGIGQMKKSPAAQVMVNAKPIRDGRFQKHAHHAVIIPVPSQINAMEHRPQAISLAVDVRLIRLLRIDKFSIAAARLGTIAPPLHVARRVGVVPTAGRNHHAAETRMQPDFTTPA